MSTIKRKLEVAARAAMLAVFLISSLVPASVEARPSTAAGPAEAGSETGEGLPEAPAAVYAPSIQIPQLDEDPQGDEVPSRVPKKEEVGLFVTAAPAGEGVFEIGVTIQNNTGKPITGLRYEDALENGFEYSANPASPVSYDGGGKKVTLTIGQVGAGETYAFDYYLKITSGKRNEIRGKAWIRDINLTGDNGLQAAAGMTVAEGAASVIALEPGEWNQVGNLKVYMDAEAVGGDGVLVVEPLAKGIDKGPKMQFELKAYRSSAKLSRKSNGQANEQAVGLGREHSGNFASPAFLEIDVNGYFDLKKIPAGQEPYVATYDEKLKIWVKVPILEQDAEANTVTVEAAHFSTWGTGLGSSLPQNGANVLLFDQPYTSLFTGSARYSIPIWTPPGRAGMAPEIALSYSSATVDGVLGDVQAPWVGVGWNIDSAEIVRKITTNDDGYGYVNEFALTLNGTLYELLVDPNQQNRYYTKQGSFLYIERHNPALGNSNGAANTTGEWWEAATTDGTRYRFGWNGNSEQTALMHGYSCKTGSPCTTPDGAYGTLGYAGKAENLVALRWRVDRVMDTHGNTITYSYDETQPSANTTLAPFDHESYLSTISYTGFEDPQGGEGNLEPGYQVKFVTAGRPGIGDVPTTFNVWDNLDSKYLDKILICLTSCDLSTQVIRTYDLDYSLAAVPNANGTLTLTSVRVSGGGFTEDGRVVPLTNAPTMRFSYQNMDNRAVSGTTDKYTYPRLIAIDNGTGGRLIYTYETDGRGTNSWYNYRVRQVRLTSGGSTTALQSYAYTDPVYTGLGGDENLGGLKGYTVATEKQLDYANGNAILLETRHTFGTEGLDVGYELQTEWLGGTTVLKKTTNTYVTDNSKAPFTGWNYRYLYQTAGYVNSGGSLILASKTVYWRDPASGNLLTQSDYLGAALYRKTYYEYIPNINPSVYILDKPSRALVVTASNTILGDTRYHYDGIINDGTRDAAPKQGDLTLVQGFTGNGNQTVDVETTYDIYGNPLSGLKYTSYGAVNVQPMGEAQIAAMEYDPMLHTYAISQTNALDEIVATEYSYRLGVPTRAADPNGWVTTTTYDGLGRKLSISVPGIDQEAVWYTYPAPDESGSVRSPYTVEMQILDTFPNPDQYRSVWGIYDGLGRGIQTQVFDEDLDQTLVTDTFYNAQGLAARQSLPYYANTFGGYYLSPNGSQFTDTVYDALGRAVKVTQPGNLATNYTYDGLITTTFDPNNNKIERATDGLGRLTSVREFDENAAVYAATRYQYDELDRLVRVTDAQENVTEINYDWLGRKTGMDDPDMGIWTYAYDPLGSLTRQVDALGQALSFTYDLLNRLKTKVDASQNLTLASYTYGSSVGLYGFRTGMSDVSGSTSWSYSNYGHTVTETKTIGGGDQSMETASDWLGRPQSVTYPDNERLTYSYDALGRPDKLNSSAETASLVDLAYNLLGQIETQALGNGVLINNLYDNETYRQGLPENTEIGNTNRLAMRRAYKDQTSLLKFIYKYDTAGNITQITDEKLGETHTYEYDFLNRLVSAEALRGSEYAYREQFSYDKIGNMLKKNEWVTPDLTPSPLSSPTGTPTGEGGSTPTAEGSPAPTETATETASPIPQETPTVTASPTGTEMTTETPTPLAYNPASVAVIVPVVNAPAPHAAALAQQEAWTDTPTPTLTPTLDLTASPSSTGEGSSTGTPTATSTPIPSPTKTPVPTNTGGPSPTPTATPWSGVDDFTNLLLQMDNLDVPAEFIDQAGKTVTTFGDAQTDTRQSKFGGASAFFDGSGDYLSVPDNNDWYFDGDFTIDLWARWNTLPSSTSQILVSQYPSSTSRWLFYVYYTSGTYYIRFFHEYSDVLRVDVISPLALEADTWYHLALVRSGNDYTIYKEGVALKTVTDTTAHVNLASPLYIGSAGTSAYFNGWIDELRISKGIARWTSNFTPPASSFGGSPLSPTLVPTPTPESWSGADGNTTALLHMDGPDAWPTFTDQTGKSWTALGNTQIDMAQSKFGGTSALFDGTGDYLGGDGSSDFAFGTGDFTIDFWMRPNNASAYLFLYESRPSGGNGAYATLYTTGSTLRYYVNSAERIVGATTLSNGVWYHVAIVRSGTTTKMYLNGVQEGAAWLDTTNYLIGASRPYIGAHSAGSYNWNGWLDELRVSKGIARWEWLKRWANEVHHVSGIVWIVLFVKLPAIETIDEQAQGTFQRIWAAGKTARLTSEACQIMTQFRIVTFDRICIRFAF